MTGDVKMYTVLLETLVKNGLLKEAVKIEREVKGHAFEIYGALERALRKLKEAKEKDEKSVNG